MMNQIHKIKISNRLLKYLQIIKHVEVVKDFSWYVGYRVILQKSVKEKWQSVRQIKQFSNRLSSSEKKITNSEVIIKDNNYRKSSI